MVLNFNFPDFGDISLTEVTNKLDEAGYKTYLTTVGGSGLGVYPVPGDVPTLGNDNLKESFTSKPRGELATWAEGQGGWLYV